MAIVSFAHRFAFIKTTKTAGTSIEVDISRCVEARAIVTPVIPSIPGHLPRNFADSDGAQQFYNHMPATELRDKLGPDVYDQLTVFCIEREPVEKCISHFHMRRNSPLHNLDGAYTHSWSDYVEEGRFPIDIAKYSAPVPGGGRRLMVDHVLRYDALPGALNTLLTDLGLTDFNLTTRAKSEYSRNRLISPRDVTASERTRIYDAFQETLEITGINWSP